MLLRYTVRNYRSFGNTPNFIDFTPYDRRSRQVAPDDDYMAHTHGSAYILGHTQSGKSNFIRSFEAARSAIVNGTVTEDGTFEVIAAIDKVPYICNVSSATRQVRIRPLIKGKGNPELFREWIADRVHIITSDSAATGNELKALNTDPVLNEYVVEMLKCMGHGHFSSVVVKGGKVFGVIEMLSSEVRSVTDAGLGRQNDRYGHGGGGGAHRGRRGRRKKAASLKTAEFSRELGYGSSATGASSGPGGRGQLAELKPDLIKFILGLKQVTRTKGLLVVDDFGAGWDTGTLWKFMGLFDYEDGDVINRQIMAATSNTAVLDHDEVEDSAFWLCHREDYEVRERRREDAVDFLSGKTDSHSWRRIMKSRSVITELIGRGSIDGDGVTEDRRIKYEYGEINSFVPFPHKNYRGMVNLLKK